MPAGTIAAIDVAEGLAWQAVAPGECVVATGFATPAFALPAAIAAQLAHPGRRVLAFAGGAGLQASAAELATARRLGTPVIVVAFGDAGAAAAEAGIDVIGAPTETTFRLALERAFGAGRPVVIDAHAPGIVLEAGSRA